MLAPVVRDEQRGQGLGDPLLSRRHRRCGQGGRGAVPLAPASRPPVDPNSSTFDPTTHRSVLWAHGLGVIGEPRLRRNRLVLKSPEQGQEILKRAGREPRAGCWRRRPVVGWEDRVIKHTCTISGASGPRSEPKRDRGGVTRSPPEGRRLAPREPFAVRPPHPGRPELGRGRSGRYSATRSGSVQLPGQEDRPPASSASWSGRS